MRSIGQPPKNLRAENCGKFTADGFACGPIIVAVVHGHHQPNQKNAMETSRQPFPTTSRQRRGEDKTAALELPDVIGFIVGDHPQQPAKDKLARIICVRPLDFSDRHLWLDCCHDHGVHSPVDVGVSAFSPGDSHSLALPHLLGGVDCAMDHGFIAAINAKLKPNARCRPALSKVARHGV